MAGRHRDDNTSKDRGDLPVEQLTLKSPSGRAVPSPSHLDATELLTTTAQITTTDDRATVDPAEGPASNGDRSVALKAVGRVGARGVSSLAFGLTLILAARATDVSHFGVMMLTYSVGLVVGILAGLGAPARVLRASASTRPTAGSLFVVHGGLVLSAFAIYSGICLVVYPHWAAIAGLILALGDTLQGFAVAQTTALELHFVANCLVLTHRLIPLAVILLSYFLIHEVRFEWLAASFIVAVAVGVVVPIAVTPVGKAVREWRTVLTGSAGYWAYSMSVLLGQLQVPILGLVTGVAAVVATYAMAMKVIGPINILTASVSVIVVPELARRIETPKSFDRLFKAVIGTAIAYFVAVTALSIPIAKVVVSLIGPQYQGAEPIIAAMVVGAGISGCSQAFNSRMLALGQPVRSTQAMVAGAATAILVITTLGLLDSLRFLWTAPVLCELVVIGIMVLRSRNLRVEDARQPTVHT